jgi:hypothetical protein
MPGNDPVRSPMDKVRRRSFQWNEMVERERQRKHTVGGLTSAAHACESPFAKSHCTVTLKLPVRVIPAEVAVTVTV